MPVKKDDFVELDYTGRLSENGSVFDTTSEDAARKAGIYQQGQAYNQVIVQVGRRHVLPGVDDRLVGAEPGTRLSFHLSPEEAFGKRNAKLIQLVPTGKFRQQQVQPAPGLQVNIDGTVGTVKTVTGGRTLVDFNHPLAGRDVDYEVTVKRVLNDAAEKLTAFFRLLGLDAQVVVKEGKATVTLKQQLPPEVAKKLAEDAATAVPDVNNVVFGDNKQPEPVQ